MNVLTPYFFAHDAFWSIFTSGSHLLNGNAFVEADTAASQPKTGPVSKVSEPLALPPHIDDGAQGVINSQALHQTDASQWRSDSFVHGGERHRFKIFIPATARRQPMPLFVMLHGAHQSADDFAAGTQMNVIAEREGFLVLYPEQAESDNLMRCWNWFRSSNRVRDTGETAWIAALTRDIMATCDVDPARVYVAGMSAGGAMAVNLAVTHPELYAAAAIHSGVAFGVADEEFSALCAMNDGKGTIRMPLIAADVPRPRNVPLIIFHGDADDVVHPRNGEQIAQMSQLLEGEPKRAINRTQTRVECEDGKHSYTIHIDRDDDGCAIGEQWLIHGLGHDWSGGHPDGTYTDRRGPDATAEIIRFMSQFTLVGNETPAR